VKIQDIVFLVVFLILFYKRDPKWLVTAGIISLFCQSLFFLSGFSLQPSVSPGTQQHFF